MSSENNNTASVEELYLKEKKKSSILLASTVVLAVLLLGSFVFGSGSDSTSGPVAENTQVGRQGQGGGRGAQSITTFFNEAGAVDQVAVDALAARVSQGGGPAGADPSQFLDRFTQQIDTAIGAGEITQEQGAALMSALAQIETPEI